MEEIFFVKYLVLYFTRTFVCEDFVCRYPAGILQLTKKYITSGS